MSPIVRPTLRVLYCAINCYLDPSNGAAVAGRMMMECLTRRGFATEALTGAMFDVGLDDEPGSWLARLGLSPRRDEGAGCAKGGRSVIVDRMVHRGVPVALHRSASTKSHPYDLSERDGYLALLEDTVDRFRPDLIVNYGSDPLSSEVRSRARTRGISVVFPLHNFGYRDPAAFASADAVLVPSRFAAEHYENALGLNCIELPNLIDEARSTMEARDPRYLTFINPSIEKGVFAFARIADELGRRRPDIPILVVESRGTEATVAACGLELREHGNIFFMGHTHDPREFWGVTKVCLLPSVWWENQPLVAVEAMVNGIPVIGSDRGGIPETLGGSGIVLSLPERITQATRILPTAEEVEPWVEAVIRLWDDPVYYEGHRTRALAEAKRWDPAVLEPQYVKFFRDLKPGTTRPRSIPPGRAKAVALVPYLGSIEPECEESLRKLEVEGVRVVRSGGNSAIDVARNRLASEALHDGFESVFFIDSDLSFDPLDALRLLARPEPVVAGIYAKKARREFASIFAEGVAEVVFGAHAFGLYPLKYAATGFLRIKAAVLRRLVEELALPLCNTRWGRGEWPFFRPIVVPQGEGREHYLGEDWAFSHRLAEIGVTPMADTSIRLWDHGRYAYGWEDVGADPKRFATYTHRFGG